MQNLSVYIRDNSVNLYREETLKNILLIIHFPLQTRATLHMIYSMSEPKWKIKLITIWVKGFWKKKKGEYGLFLIIESKKLAFVSDAFSYSFFLSLSLCLPVICIPVYACYMHTCLCVCVSVRTYLNFSVALMPHKKNVWEGFVAHSTIAKGR